MRPSLPHPRSEPRRSRRHRRGSQRAAPAQASTAARERVAVAADPAVRRVREAGGPTDRASYTCACGLLFSADVSTTVTCPHCGTGQAW